VYDDWYGFTHPRPDELVNWSYGLPELERPSGRLVANPGCYATAALLALGPLKDVVDPDSVVVDAKSGMTGAGRSLTPASHAGFVLENVSAYKVGEHQHAPEIAQALGFPVAFTPHLLPVRRPELQRIPNWPRRLDHALNRIDRLVPAGKELLVQALVRTISHDLRMTVAESELLRAICAAVHCPLPPLHAAAQEANP